MEGGGEGLVRGDFVMEIVAVVVVFYADVGGSDVEVEVFWW